MARMHDVVIDCAHPASLARFWAQALDDHEIAPYDEPELARLVALGASVVGRDGIWFVLADPEGNEFCLSSTEHPLSPEA